MILPKMLLAKRAIKDKLKKIKKTGGGKYDTCFVELDDNLTPTRDVEITMGTIGFENAEAQPIQHTRRNYLFQCTILVARRLANDDTPIDEVALIVSADIEEVVMQDIQQKNTAITTEIRGGTVTDSPADSHFAWGMVLAVEVQTLQDKPFN